MSSLLVNSPAVTSRRRRSVSFDEQAQVLCFDSLAENRSELWFTADEYRKIKRRNRVFIQLARTGSFEESEQHTLLGLERHTSPRAGAQRKQQRARQMAQLQRRNKV